MGLLSLVENGDSLGLPTRLSRYDQSFTFQCDTQVVKLDMSRYVQNTVTSYEW